MEKLGRNRAASLLEWLILTENSTSSFKAVCSFFSYLLTMLSLPLLLSRLNNSILLTKVQPLK